MGAEDAVEIDARAKRFAFLADGINECRRQRFKVLYRLRRLPAAPRAMGGELEDQRSAFRAGKFGSCISQQGDYPGYDPGEGVPYRTVGRERNRPLQWVSSIGAVTGEHVCDSIGNGELHTHRPGPRLLDVPINTSRRQCRDGHGQEAVSIGYAGAGPEHRREGQFLRTDDIEVDFCCGKPGVTEPALEQRDGDT